MTISLQSRTGHSNLQAIVGILVFSQFWFWYPLTHFLSLSFTPTCTIGLNSDLKMPKVEMRSNAKPSTFAYAPNLEEKKENKKDKVETAILSITAKQKKKEAEKKKDEEKMEVDEKADDGTEKKPADKPEKTEKMDTEKEKEKDGEKEKEEKKKEPEPNFEMLKNPARTMRAQLKVLTMPEGGRYTPLKDICNGGIILMRDVTPGEKEEIVEAVIAGGPKVEEEEEPEPPEPFEWTED